MDLHPVEGTFHVIKIPLWWSSGQRARLLLRRSEFESCYDLQFFLENLCLKRTKINKKRPGLAHFINIIIQVEKESGKRPVKRISVKERYHLSTCTCLTSKLILKIKNLRDLVVCR